MQTAFGLLECMEYFLFLKSFHKAHFFCTFVSDFSRSKEKAHSPFQWHCSGLTEAQLAGEHRPWDRLHFIASCLFSEFVVLISANLMRHQRDDHCKWLPAPCIEELLVKQGILLILQINQG